MKNDELLRLAEELRKAPQVALFSHVSPDGDCIGSMLAIGLALEKMGKVVQYYNPDSLPHNLTFLPGALRITSHSPSLPNLLLFIDCADFGRSGLPIDQITPVQTVLNLDHHISNEYFGHINLVDPNAAASGEIAYFLINELGDLIDKDIATNLYTAIVTDTGSYQFSNTTAQTHRITASLIEKGIDLADIHHHLYDQKPLAQLNLLQRALSNLEIGAEGRLAFMTLTLQDFEASGAEDALSEGLVNHARTIQGVEVAVLLREVEQTKVKAGLRSNQWLNVNEIAGLFGGGGHKRAAGCTLNLPLIEAKYQLWTSIEEALKLGWNH